MGRRYGRRALSLGSPISSYCSFVDWPDLSVLSSFEEFHRPPGGLPGKMPAGHVASIEPGLAQDGGGLASDMEAIDAEGHDRIGLRQLADPFVDAFRIAPHRPFHHVLRPAAVVARPRVEDLDRRAGCEH